jgi:beta-lactamase class A
MRMRMSVAAVSAVAMVVIASVSCTKSKLSAQNHDARSPQIAARVIGPPGVDSSVAGLSERLRALASQAGGTVGIAVIHVETGQTVSIDGAKQLPLYSVFKLPLAVAVLKSVEENRLLLEKKIRVTPEDVAPGSQFNLDLWRQPVERSVRELIEVSIVRSDNTSSDKLLELVGGPSAVTERMRSMGFMNIDVHSTTRELAAHRVNPNTGSAEDLARLLTQLQSGQILKLPQLELLLGFMRRALTGEKRLRGNLPKNTPVADKSGTGEAGSTTNDVGIITLPADKGHLAMAVLISGSKLPATGQEQLIAELARAAYDSYVSMPAQAGQPAAP